MVLGKAGHGLMMIFYVIESRFAAPLIMLVTGLLSALAVYGVQGLCSQKAALLGVVSGITIPVAAVLFAIFCLIISSWSHDGGKADHSKFVEFKNASDVRKWKGVKIPIETVFEAYMAGDLEMKKDFHEVWLHRNQLFRFCFTWSIIKFYVGTFIGQNFR
jgi:hypothetical protein